MMRRYWPFLLIALLLLVLLAVLMQVRSKHQMEATIIIGRYPEQVTPFLLDLEKVTLWAPTATVENPTPLEVGISKTIAVEMDIEPKVLVLTLTKAETDEAYEADVVWQNPAGYQSWISVELASVEEGTQVTCNVTTQATQLSGRLHSIFFTRFSKPQLDHILTLLKHGVEHSTVRMAEVELEEDEGFEEYEEEGLGGIHDGYRDEEADQAGESLE